MEKRKIMISDTYIPDFSTEFRLHASEDEKEFHESGDAHRLYSRESDTIKIGMADGWRKNSLYKNLISNYGIGLKESQEIINQVRSGTLFPSKSNRACKNHPFKYSKWIETIDQHQKNFVIQCFKNNWTLK